jgi:hypothetical protein
VASTSPPRVLHGVLRLRISASNQLQSGALVSGISRRGSYGSEEAGLGQKGQRQEGRQVLTWNRLQLTMSLCMLKLDRQYFDA